MIELTDRINHVRAFKWRICIYFLVKVKEEETQVLKNNFWIQVCIFSLYIEFSIIWKIFEKKRKVIESGLNFWNIKQTNYVKAKKLSIQYKPIHKGSKY